MGLTLSRKIGLGIGTLLIIFATFGFILYLMTLNIEKNIKNIIHLEEPASAAAYEMEINLIGTGFAVIGYLHDHDPIHLERIKKDKKDFEDFHKRYDEFADTEKEKELGLKVKQGYDEFIALAYELIRIEDEQTRKMDLFARNINKIDDILDDNIQISIKTDDPQHDQKIRTSYGMEVNVYEIFSRMSEYLRTHSAPVEARIYKDEQDFREYFEGYKNLKLSPEERQLTAKLGSLFDENVRFAKDIVTMDKTKEKGLAKLVQMRRELDMVLDEEIQLKTHVDLHQAKDSAINSVNSSRIYGIIAFLLSLVSGVLGGVLITRGITRPLHQLVEATEIIGKGDLSQRVKVKTGDEIGYLAESFNQMMVELQKTTVTRDYVENILNSMGESLIVVSRDGRIESVNPAACNLLGYTEDELIGQSYQKVLIDEDLNSEISAKGSILGAESVYLSKNNERIPVLLTVSVMKDKNDFITGNILIAEDITERKRAEEALRQSENKYRILIKNLPQKIFLKDRNSIYVSCNENYARDLKIRPDEITGKTDYDFYPKELAEKYRADDQRIMRLGNIEDIEERYIQNGQEAWVHTVKTPIKDEKGNVTGILGIFWDITEHKKAEDALWRSEARFRILAESSPVGIFLDDAQGNAIYVNDRCAELVGLSPKECLGLSWVPSIHPDDRERVTSEWVKAVEQGTTFHQEYRWVHSDGSVVSTIGLVAPVRGEDGEVILFVGTLIDITERKRAEEELKSSHKQLRALSAQLAEVEEAERKYLARELHDKVGQNLSALGINLNIIRSQMPKEAADLICSRLDDSLSLIEQTTLHIRDVMADLRPELLDDYGLMAALRLYAERFSVRTGITIKIFGKELIPHLPSAVETILFRIAQEVLTNVAKHARASKVIVTLEEAAGMVQLTFVDDGKGFDPAAFRQIGEPLVWGLITMKERAIALGGHLRIESAPGKGTTIIVEMKR